MARVRKFDEPGAKEDRIRWNKAGTRKWLTVYTVMEYRPKDKAEPSNGKVEKQEKAKPKKTKPPKAKPPKAKPQKAKATDKPTTKRRARKPKPASD